jgi:polyferredoxin
MITPNTVINYIQRFSWILVAFILVFGWTSPVLMLLTFMCMIGPVIFSITYGRAWCGNFCPRGSLSSAVLCIISPKKKIPKLFKNTWFRIAILMSFIVIFVFGLSQPHPTLTCLGSLFIKMMALTTILQVILAVAIHQYAWCNLCPMVTLAYLVTKVKKGSVSNIHISITCTACNVCAEECPVGVNISDWRVIGEVKDADCIKCRKCINNCNNHCLKFND